MEELILKKINCGIRGIKLGTKTPEEARVGYWLNRLKEIDSVWYEECFSNYIKINKMYNEKKNSMK
jgi:hypothetical protein